MATVHNFLQQGVEHVRQSILDIDDSYNNDWDILAELVQNAVDAIRDKEMTDGTIDIVIDSQNKSVSVKDNCIGIEPNELPKLLCMFGTNKKMNEKTIGEKGVGLKFAIFSCNDFYIRSSTSNGACEAIVVDAFNWKNSVSPDFLCLEYDDRQNDFVGTEVVLKKLPDLPLFDLTLNQIIFILRTRTAIGNTLKIWDKDDVNITVSLKFVNQEGQEFNENIPFTYWLPTDNIIEQDKINIDDYYDYVRNGDKTDQQKRLKLKNKIVYKVKIFELRNRVIKTYSCLVPKWATWDVISASANLAKPDQLKDDDFMEKFGYATFQAGNYTSVKGMPTGISMEHPMTGSGGTWAQVFMIFEDKKLKFDIGRKSIHGKQKNIYKEFSRELFNEYRSLLKYISGDVNPEASSWDKDEVFKEIENLIDIKSKSTIFAKTPRDQEGTVAALFFEAMGNKKITSIKPLIPGYKNKYDLYALWDNKRVVIEFKSQLYKILKDFTDETKIFNEVNCVVCWDVSEDDAQEFADVGITLEKIPPKSLLNPTEKNFPHATHTLRYSAFVYPVYVIDMKILLECE